MITRSQLAMAGSRFILMRGSASLIALGDSSEPQQSLLYGGPRNLLSRHPLAHPNSKMRPIPMPVHLTNEEQTGSSPTPSLCLLRSYQASASWGEKGVMGGFQ